jgi:hypothetical protein
MHYSHFTKKQFVRWETSRMSNVIERKDNCENKKYWWTDRKKENARNLTPRIFDKENKWFYDASIAGLPFNSLAFLFISCLGFKRKKEKSISGLQNAHRFFFFFFLWVTWTVKGNTVHSICHGVNVPAHGGGEFNTLIVKYVVLGVMELVICMITCSKTTLFRISWWTSQ